MLTVKLFKPAPHESDKNSVIWEIISCERFQINEREKCAEVVTFKKIPSVEGISWFLSNDSSDCYTQCFVENEHGKTVYKYIADASIPSLTD